MLSVWRWVCDVGRFLLNVWRCGCDARVWCWVVWCWACDVGCVALGAWCWVCDVAGVMLRVWCECGLASVWRWAWDVGCVMLSVWCWLCDVECVMLEVRCWVCDVGCVMLGVWYWVCDVECVMLSTARATAEHFIECKSQWQGHTQDEPPPEGVNQRQPRRRGKHNSRASYRRQITKAATRIGEPAPEGVHRGKRYSGATAAPPMDCKSQK